VSTPVLPDNGPVTSPMRVLLVENDDADALRIEAGLRERLGDGVIVRRVATLGQGIRALIEGSFDVIVLELGVPDASGIATLAGIRGAASGVPVVVYTRSLDDSLALRALRAGAQECLAKTDTPPEALGRVLQFAIERQRRLASLEAARVEASHRATHDPLTGLANRHLFLNHLERALAFGSRYGRKTGVLFVDLDGFKGINDEHGHACGDAILRAVSVRLIESVRRSDAVARLGGDEFVVLLPDVTSRRDVAHVRDTILDLLRAPIDVAGQHLVVDASVGGAMSPLDGSTAQELLDAADAEMYRDKSHRRDARIPTPMFGVPAVRGDEGAAVTSTAHDLADASPEFVTHHRESRMRIAVQQDEFEVHYQPIVDVVQDRIVGAEALLRWRDPGRGLLLPASFLSLAEDTGLIVPIGERVLRDACEAVVSWRGEPGTASLRVGVNIAAVQLRERGFAHQVARILRETECPVDAIVFELTERSLLVDGEIAMESLRELKALGLRLVVDDFGVGHASLTFVREAPVDGIKLDRRFVSNMLMDSRDHAIVESMVRLAYGLNLDVTAEGVESAELSHRLSRLQCFAQQGRYFSGELSAAEFLRGLREFGPTIDGLVRRREAPAKGERSAAMRSPRSVRTVSLL
jgi:diguanylate cyclase (GGDEF)-like protein